MWAGLVVAAGRCAAPHVASGQAERYGRQGLFSLNLISTTTVDAGL